MFTGFYAHAFLVLYTHGIYSVCLATQNVLSFNQTKAWSA